MLQVDVLSAFVICGAGSLVGAAMMRLVDSDDAAVRRALRLCSVGFLLLGAAMGSLYFVGPVPGRLSQSLVAAGTLAGLVVFIPAVALLSGEAPLRRWQGAGLVAGTLAIALLGPRVDDAARMWAVALAIAVATSLLALQTRRFLLHPRDLAERAVGMSLAVLAASAWARCAFALATPGEPPPHLLHLPGWLLSPFAVLYGMLPILVATLILSLVNARLRRNLNLRATTDELTGVLTRRALRELAPALIDRQRDGSHGVAVLMMDLDHFKAVNDRFGHASGDLALQRAGEMLHAQARQDSLLARYGGEEFVALVPVPDLRVARQVAERMREAVAGARWLATDGRVMPVTLSAGVALVGAHETLDAALQRADEALYRAKNEGRNQVQVAILAA